MDEKFLHACRPGKSLMRYYNDGNVNNAILHIRALVDDDFVVYRIWVARRRAWDYRVVPIADLLNQWEAGTLRPRGKVEND